jgi:DNA-binding MarR family transcriptional regulator
MCPAFFDMKRAFQSALRVGLDALRDLDAKGLTCARFDMMYVLQFHPRCTRVTQRDLQDALGVSATTVSRMARALEKLGYLHRQRNPKDRRSLLVRLTDVGRALFDRTRRALMEGRIDDVVSQAALPAYWSGREKHPLYGRVRRRNKKLFEKAIARMRRRLGDRARLDYLNPYRLAPLPTPPLGRFDRPFPRLPEWPSAT